ncbi:MAG: WbuC family cupin fold metalloprotein [Rhodocyclales bacterium]|nr:WbuC family cupin fold metalloprotein [Rhodocyclales bacterium]
MRLIDGALLTAVSADAAARPRRRANHNFHPADDFPAHRLLNAIEPDSYLPPHRHLDPAKDESIIVLRGELGVLRFDDAGTVLDVWRLSAGGDRVGVDIPHGTWHTVIALQPGTVIFEAKSGPYRPLGDAEKAPWAPAEGDAAAADYWRTLRQRFSDAS